MCRKLYICKDDSKWDTCGVEKMWCQGCYYFQQLNEYSLFIVLKEE